MRILDISNDLLTAEVYPDDPVPELAAMEALEDGSCYNVNAIYAGLHNGTHIDAPLHVFSDGADVASVPLDTCIGPCCVLSVPSGILTGEYMENHYPEGAERVLLKSGGRAFLHESAAEVMVQRGCRLIGTDGLSVEQQNSTGSVHRSLLNEGVVLLEGLNLEEAGDGQYFLFAPPVKISTAEAAFTRAVLITDYIFWSGKQNG